MLPSAAMSVMQMGIDATQQKATQAEAKAEAQAQARQIQEGREIDSRQRRDQLRRALATQRARFGAQGLAAGGGSVDAALSGLEAEAEREESDAQRLTDTRMSRLSEEAGWQRRRNLLDASASRYRSSMSLVQRSLRSVPLLGGE
jgi:hypothetical protein